MDKKECWFNKKLKPKTNLVMASISLPLYTLMEIIWLVLFYHWITFLWNIPTIEFTNRVLFRGIIMGVIIVFFAYFFFCVIIALIKIIIKIYKQL